MSHQDNENDIQSELIWTFDDINKELVNKYAVGKAHSEKIKTINNEYEWQIDLYPNGRDKSTQNRVFVSLRLLGVNKSDKEIEADCEYKIIFKDSRPRPRNYIGQINKTKFNLTNSNEANNSEFETSVLTADASGQSQFIFTIHQFTPVYDTIDKQNVKSVSSSSSKPLEKNDDDPQTVHLSELSSAPPTSRSLKKDDNDDDDGENFQKVSAKNLY
jgi:hypothetical protein